MKQKKSPAWQGGADSDAVTNSNTTTIRQAAQRAWSDDELRQLRQRQRNAWPHHVGEGYDRGIESLPSFTLHHVAPSDWWLVELADGDKVALTTRTITSNARFCRECFLQLTRVFAPMPAEAWRNLLNEAARPLRERRGPS